MRTGMRTHTQFGNVALVSVRHTLDRNDLRRGLAGKHGHARAYHERYVIDHRANRRRRKSPPKIIATSEAPAMIRPRFSSRLRASAALDSMLAISGRGDPFRAI